MYGGHVTLAAHWLKMEEVALEKLAACGAGKRAEDEDGPLLDEDFYASKVQTAAFVFDCLLPRTRSLKEGILAPPASVMDMPNDHFSFDHAR